MKEANVLWDRDAYHAAPSHIRMRLKTTTPTILCNEANVIVAANQAWQDQCGYGEEAIGATPKILQGELTDKAKAHRFMKRAVEEGRAGTSLVNYKADGSAFLHTVVADKVGAYYFAKTSRAVDMLPKNQGVQVIAIGIALILTHALVLTFSAMSKTLSASEVPSGVSSWGYASIFGQAQILQNEMMMPDQLSAAIPLAAFFLLSFLIVAIDDLSTNAPDKVKEINSVDRAVFDSMLLGLAAFIVSEVPSSHLGLMKPALALSGLMLVASLAASREQKKKNGVWHPHQQTEAREALPQIAVTTAACLFLVTQGPLQMM